MLRLQSHQAHSLPMGFHWKSQFLLSTKDPSHNSNCHGIPTSSASPCFTSKLFIPCDWGWVCRELAPLAATVKCACAMYWGPRVGVSSREKGSDVPDLEGGGHIVWWSRTAEDPAKDRWVVWAGMIMIKRTPSLPLLCRQSWWSYGATEYFIDGKLDLEGVLGMWILVSQPPSPDGWSVSVPTWFLGHRREQVRTIFFQWGQPVFVPWTWEEQTLPLQPSQTHCLIGVEPSPFQLLSRHAAQIY